MCGIIGYTGPKNSLEVIMDGLKKIEYRGYDSSGVVLQTSQKTLRIRSEGSLQQLEEKIHQAPKGQAGLGHVRWATHGIANETNAHPHQSGKIYIVHNGIIENDKELKEEFSNQTFYSQTDTEVISCLIHYFYSKGNSLLESVIQTNQKLKGSYAYVILCENKPGHIIGCRKGPPLIVGWGKENEFFISSDLPSLSQWTQKVSILENEEIFHIHNEKCEFFSFDGKKIQKTTEVIERSCFQKELKGYPHYMLKEICEQPVSVLDTLKAYVDFNKNSLCLKSKKSKKNLGDILQKSKKLFIVACGSSYYAGLYGKYVIESLARKPVEVELASEFQYRDLILQKDDVVLFISQSGETADTLLSLETAKAKGVFCISLCNVPNSSLDRRSDFSLYLHAGSEVSVASTKAFTSTLAAMILIALSKPSSKVNPAQVIQSLKTLPQKIEDVLSRKDFFLKHIEEFKKYQGFLYLGRGPHYPIALEGALKMKELAYIHAEGYPSGEMKHGPLALIHPGLLTIGLDPMDKYYQKNLMNLEEVAARKGQLLTLGNFDDQRLQAISTYHFGIPKILDVISPLLEVVALQLLSYYTACSLGHNVDRPRNLAKSVTVE